jgi:murein DD-endopeptidase MepM/ murein hydrolase activator NlpD
VKSGDTLSSIAAQFNLSLDQLLTDNSITKGTPLLVGQTLIVGAPAVTPTPVLNPTQAATLAPIPTVSASTSASTPLGLCLLAFDDVNGNGTRDSGEGLTAGVKFEVKSADGQSVATYTSDGVKEPDCLTNLPDGRYSIEVTPPDGQLATTDTRWSLSLLSSTAVNIAFGSQAAPAAATATPSAAPTAVPAATASGNGSSALTLLVGGAFVLLAMAALFLGLRPRRK